MRSRVGDGGGGCLVGMVKNIRADFVSLYGIAPTGMLEATPLALLSTQQPGLHGDAESPR